MELSLNELRGFLAGGPKGHGFEVGQKLFFRTVTYHITGEITSVDGDFVTLKDAAWIADSGRFADAIRTGEYAEVEPLPDGWRVNVTAVTDCGPVSTLPMTQK